MKEKKVYHYTSEFGAKGILESNSLWITHSSFLDDTAEVKYISKVLKGVLIYLFKHKEHYGMGVGRGFYVYEFIINTLQALKETYKQGAPITGGNLFLLSLTENKANQYLSDNYCREKGAILEFTNNLNDMFKNEDYTFPVFSARVKYEYSEQMTILLEDINEFYAEIGNNLCAYETIDWKEVAETVKLIINLKILHYSFFFKDYKFHKEEEYRVMFLVEEDSESMPVKYRIKSGRQIPYIELKFNKESLIQAKFV
ncbi:MAG TPA: hypothetical protein GX707_01350 [Epulopiscium sp.]|nr:hypothetical protein [Candidatus Epulonipiscium sp.]